MFEYVSSNFPSRDEERMHPIFYIKPIKNFSVKFLSEVIFKEGVENRVWLFQFKHLLFMAEAMHVKFFLGDSKTMQ